MRCRGGERHLLPSLATRVQFLRPTGRSRENGLVQVMSDFMHAAAGAGQNTVSVSVCFVSVSLLQIAKSLGSLRSRNVPCPIAHHSFESGNLGWWEGSVVLRWVNFWEEWTFYHINIPLLRDGRILKVASLLFLSAVIENEWGLFVSMRKSTDETTESRRRPCFSGE